MGTGAAPFRADSGDESRGGLNRGLAGTRLRLLMASTGVAVAILISGITMVGVSIEPNSDVISSEPWLVVLATDRVGIVFVTYGRDFSAVLYGVADSRGNWLVGPSPVTARYGYFLYPYGAVPVADSEGRIHLAWTLVDGFQNDQSFHYIQFDSVGRVIATAGPLGNRSVPDGRYGPVTPLIRVNASTVDVVWSDGGYWAATLDLNGRVIQQAHPIAGNVSAPPRVPSPSPSAFGSSASVGSDGAGSTYYVWQQQRFRQAGRQSVLEFDLGFYRVGPGGAVDRILYSTDDFYWTTKPLALPGFVLTIAGLVTVPILASLLTALWRRQPRGKSR